MMNKPISRVIIGLIFIALAGVRITIEKGLEVWTMIFLGYGLFTLGYGIYLLSKSKKD